MKIKKIFIKNYKNIGEEGITIHCNDGINAFIGKNGSGKSAVFECVNGLLNFDVEFLKPLCVPEKKCVIEITLEVSIYVGIMKKNKPDYPQNSRITKLTFSLNSSGIDIGKFYYSDDKNDKICKKFVAYRIEKVKEDKGKDAVPLNDLNLLHLYKEFFPQQYNIMPEYFKRGMTNNESYQKNEDKEKNILYHNENLKDKLSNFDWNLLLMHHFFVTIICVSDTNSDCVLPSIIYISTDRNNYDEHSKKIKHVIKEAIIAMTWN